MEFLKDHIYIICFNVFDKPLTFTCTILEDSEHTNDFVKFTDKFGKELSYNKSNIVSSEEVKE